MELLTERLRLVPHGTEYILTTCDYAMDIENTQYMLNLPADSVESTLEYLKYVEGEWAKTTPLLFEFAIFYEGVHIGSLGIDVDEERTEAEFGWIINKKYWNRGITYEAAKAVMEFAKEELGVKRFFAHCDSENIGSYRVMEKLGMVRKDCYGGRKNKSSKEERMECLYELLV